MATPAAERVVLLGEAEHGSGWMAQAGGHRGQLAVGMSMSTATHPSTAPEPQAWWLQGILSVFWKIIYLAQGWVFYFGCTALVMNGVSSIAYEFSYALPARVSVLYSIFLHFLPFFHSEDKLKGIRTERDLIHLHSLSKLREVREVHSSCLILAHLASFVRGR